jgi:hypothetical protein
VAAIYPLRQGALQNAFNCEPKILHLDEPLVDTVALHNLEPPFVGVRFTAQAVAAFDRVPSNPVVRTAAVLPNRVAVRTPNLKSNTRC